MITKEENPFVMHNNEINEKRKALSVANAIFKELGISNQAFYNNLRDCSRARIATIEKMLKDDSISNKTRQAYERLLNKRIDKMQKRT